LAELTEAMRRAGFVDIRAGQPVDVLAGAKGEPPARQFEPIGIAVSARKSGLGEEP
jgi:hypothetical protein